MKLTIEQLADKVNEIVTEHFKDNPEAIKDGRQSPIVSTRRIRDYITKGLLEKPLGNGREKWFEQSHVDALVSLRLLQHNGLSEQYILSSTRPEIAYEEPIEYYYGEEEIEKESNLLAEGLSQGNNFNPLLLNEHTDEVTKRFSSGLRSSDKDLQNNAMDFLKSLQGGVATNSSLASGYRTEAENKKIVANAVTTSAAKSLHSSVKDSLLGGVKSVFAKGADLGLLKSFAESQPKYKQFNEYCVDENLGVFLKLDSKLDGQLQKKLFETIKKEINNHMNTKENKND